MKKKKVIESPDINNIENRFFCTKKKETRINIFQFFENIFLTKKKFFYEKIIRSI